MSTVLFPQRIFSSFHVGYQTGRWHLIDTTLYTQQYINLQYSANQSTLRMLL